MVLFCKGVDILLIMQGFHRKNVPHPFDSRGGMYQNESISCLNAVNL